MLIPHVCSGTYGIAAPKANLTLTPSIGKAFAVGTANDVFTNMVVCWNTCHVASGWNNDIKASAADVIIAKFFHDRHKALLPVGGLSSK